MIHERVTPLLAVDVTDLLDSVSRVPASTSDQDDRQCGDIYEDLCALRRRSAFMKVAGWQMRDDCLDC